MTFDEIQVGNTFENSNGNLTTVIFKNNNYIKCRTNRVDSYVITKKEFERRSKSNLYTDFNLKNQVQGWKCGPLDRENAMELIKHMGASGITTTKSNNYFYFDGKNDFGRYTTGVKGPARDYFFESKLPQKFLDNILRNNLVKKDVDLNDTKNGTQDNFYKQYPFREINKQLILNINNEKRTEINTEYRRQESGTAISSNSPRKVAVASRLIGNAISNRVKTTRVGRFEISKHAISC